MAGTLKEHGAILQAIRDRDPQAAERAMADHTRCASERLWSSLSAEDSGTSG